MMVTAFQSQLKQLLVSVDFVMLGGMGAFGHINGSWGLEMDV